ncbi:GIY-YIG nuclease family protein [Flavobacterium sp. MFBS3-15]|uniref:GIY-YIG nuclease family protein n=1 Tax=Flavobacterium sp. MFBS3-15 TaxID=2989816 RepID=UPI0022359AD3|nr:GIY-YIG nuclease family protein [Flavobacterium sp. MFBS3-15]MCW4469090.1 GIY-YIG nuclease family protein [Flavobacterium sp. MFBS3-15]
MQNTLGTHNYYVYIMTNKVKTVLYIGFTKDLRDRVYNHNTPDPLSKAFTAKYRCFYLIYWEHYSDVQIAIDRETELKKWRRSKKDALISEFNPDWKFLNDEI